MIFDQTFGCHQKGAPEMANIYPEKKKSPHNKINIPKKSF